MTNWFVQTTHPWNAFPSSVSFILPFFSSSFEFSRELSLHFTVIYNICEDFQLDFYAMYACVGLWNTVFLILYAVFDVSKLMKWCTRSTEEIFSLFISIAFAVDAGRDVVKSKLSTIIIFDVLQYLCYQKLFKMRFNLTIALLKVNCPQYHLNRLGSNTN